MINFKKLTAIILSVSTMLALASCGETDKDDAKNDKSHKNVTEAVEVAEDKTSTEDKTSAENKTEKNTSAESTKAADGEETPKSVTDDKAEWKAVYKKYLTDYMTLENYTGNEMFYICQHGINTCPTLYISKGDTSHAMVKVLQSAEDGLRDLGEFGEFGTIGYLENSDKLVVFKGRKGHMMLNVYDFKKGTYYEAWDGDAVSSEATSDGKTTFFSGETVVDEKMYKEEVGKNVDGKVIMIGNAYDPADFYITDSGKATGYSLTAENIDKYIK